jgi:hypothetical protein
VRLLVSGSRTWSDRSYLFGVLDGIHASQDVTVVIEGEGGNADLGAKDWAGSHRIKLLPFPADWDHFGKSAGPIRNRHMLASGRPELVVAFWDGASPGTKDMIGAAREAGVEVWIFRGVVA